MAARSDRDVNDHARLMPLRVDLFEAPHNQKIMDDRPR
jgi:hypothetical protein